MEEQHMGKAVQRIKKLDIDGRPMFTGIYGLSPSEYFIDRFGKTYNLLEELYTYLHEQGYLAVFYNQADNFFSYREEDLETFLRKEAVSDTTTSAGVGRHPRCCGPLGYVGGRGKKPVADVSNRGKLEEPRATKHGLLIHYPDIVEGGSDLRGWFFRTKNGETPFANIFNYIDSIPKSKLCIVFTNSDDNVITQQERDRLTSISHEFARKDVQFRILVLYQYSNFEDVYKYPGTIMERSLFIDPQKTYKGNNYMQLQHHFFCIERPGMDEIGNVLNRRRIVGGMKNTFSIDFESVKRQIWQQFIIKKEGYSEPIEIETVLQMLDTELLPNSLFEEYLSNLRDKNPMDVLEEEFLGIEGIVEQFKKYLFDFEKSLKAGEKFRRHMVFTGNPGTGKTSVARLMADVLSKKGMLENGRLYQVTVGDLVDNVIGGTRIKAEAVCRKAQGGVLFIDEAYGLYQSQSADEGRSNNDDFGKEAVEVLLQHMENDKNFLVIMAGYTHEMEEMLHHANPGLNSRIGEHGRFKFDDYKPEVLTQMALRKIKDKTTEKFNSDLRAIFEILFQFRGRTWGNAREAENVVSEIRSNYRSQGTEGPYDVNAIPEKYLRLVTPITDEREAEIMKKLDCMVGLQKVKDELRRIFNETWLARMQTQLFGAAKTKMRPLTFRFEGNPGTGKTTVARLMGEILEGYGLLLDKDVFTFTKADLVSTFKGGSPKLVDAAFEKCVGRVMFIDEAYSLADDDAKDAVDQIVNNMTSVAYQGKMAIILAGYPGDMGRLMNVNPGIERRFSYLVEFDDYTVDELTQMYIGYVDEHNLKIKDDCIERVNQWFRERIENKTEKSINGGYMEKIHSLVNANMGKRLKSLGGEYLQNHPDDAIIITREDIPINI